VRVELQHQPAYTIAVCFLSKGESMTVERDGMVAMSSGVKAGFGVGAGGVAKGLMRKVLGQENLFTGQYTAEEDGCWVAVAPAFPGDLHAVDLRDGRDLHITQGSFVAACETVDIGVRAGGVTTTLLAEGVTLLTARGHGPVLFSSYGAIWPVTLPDGASVVADSGHLAAWDSSVRVRAGLHAGVLNAVGTGEGFVATLTGPGTVFLQTRAERAMRSWLFPDQWQNTRNR
jgi:uncharacterized protein (TIGR00266 family)